MVYNKGKDILSSDLDIFGEGADEEQKTTGDEYDIFWWGDEADEDPAEEAAETPEEEAAEETEEPTPSSEEWNTDSEKDSGEDEVLDIDIENLFNDLEQETKWNTELEALIDSLRTEISSLTTERNMLQKENSTINENLMSKVWDESSLWMYKWVISNLEDNPKLMMLVKHLWKSESEPIKNKLVSILTDMIYDVTWEDVSDLINKNQSDKILASTWKTGWASLPEPKDAEEEKDMDYDESIHALF